MTSLAKDLAVAIGDRVRELRVERHLSQAALAERIGSHREIVCRVERGVHALSLQGLHVYARGLEVDVFEIALVLDDVVDVHLGAIRGGTVAASSPPLDLRHRPYAMHRGALAMPAGERYARRALNAWSKRPTEAV